MGNSLRCCLACVLPCGALDLIRIVHLNGCVDEITRPITAREILDANPNHLLTKPTSQGVVRRILVLSPETELKRGTIYFLIPASSVPEKKRIDLAKKPNKNNKIAKTNSSHSHFSSSQCDANANNADLASSEKKSSRRDRRSGRVGIWRPHLESISED
ncbi:DUF4228 domain protein [Senna tora]|uniref:DUF4228 domain protein n=1 Tax=Senna tora TaxID=362788 RepID=A0A834WBD3_9FABA|nr:DUF4228 domain protein [Senna tora]